MNIFCIEQNYLTHKREREILVPREINIFIKPSNALLPINTVFKFDKFEDYKLYAQCELVLRISKSGSNISSEDAGDYYDAFTTGVNFTQINIHDELSGVSVSWEEAKAWPNSSVIGEWFPSDDVKNKRDINFCLYKNREMVQIANAELMIHDFDSIISSISKKYALAVGDIIFTGTPAGICDVSREDMLETFFEDDTVIEFEITE